MKWINKFLFLGVSTLFLLSPLFLASCGLNDNQKPSEEPNTTPVLKPDILSIKLGGNSNGLNYSSYFVIAKELNLNCYFRLNTITNDSLKEVINQNEQLLKINLSIKYGSQSESVLVLNISGEYNKINIPNNEEIIITGFYTNSKSYNIFDNMLISQTEIIFENYLENFQTKDNASDWNGKDLLDKYLSIFNARAFTSNGVLLVNLVELYQKGIIINPTISNFADIINETNNWNRAKINFDYVNYKWISNQWVIETTKSFSFNFLNKSSFTFPTLIEITKFIIDNKKTHLNKDVNNVIYKNFASTVLINMKIDEYSTNYFVSIDKKYMETYFSTNSNDINYIELTGDSILTESLLDDWNGNLDIAFYLTLPNLPFSPSYSGSIYLKDFLKFSDFFNKYKNEKQNIIEINNKLELKARIINSINKEISKDNLLSMKINDIKNMISKSELIRASSYSYYVFNGSAIINNQYDSQLLGYGNFNFLGQIFKEGSINWDTGSYKNVENNRFVVSNILLKFEDDTKPFLIKKEKGFEYRVKCTYDFSILNKNIKINTYYFYFISNSDLNLF